MFLIRDHGRQRILISTERLNYIQAIFVHDDDLDMHVACIVYHLRSDDQRPLTNVINKGVKHVDLTLNNKTLIFSCTGLIMIQFNLAEGNFL